MGGGISRGIRPDCGLQGGQGLLSNEFQSWKGSGGVKWSSRSRERRRYLQTNRRRRFRRVVKKKSGVLLTPLDFDRRDMTALGKRSSVPEQKGSNRLDLRPRTALDHLPRGLRDRCMGGGALTGMGVTVVSPLRCRLHRTPVSPHGLHPVDAIIMQRTWRSVGSSGRNPW